MSEQVLTKECRSCKTVKPINEFYDSKQNRDKHNSYCKTCCNDKTLDWQKNNRDKVNAWKREYMHIPQNRIAHNGRVAIRKVIKNMKPEYKFLVECGAGSREVFMNHLISTIPEGYTIDDYGTILAVDHIKPCCAFDLTKRTEYVKCFNYKNLRLVTAKENFKKAGKVL